MLKKSIIQVEGFGEIAALPGRLFLDVLNEQGFDLHNPCGGHGKCGRCRIAFHTAAPDALPGDFRHLSPELRAGGLRLACFHQVRGDCRITIPPPPEGELLDDLER